MSKTKSHHGDTEARSKAARKGAKTRAANRAHMEYYRDITRPGMQHLQQIMTHMLGLCQETIRLRYLAARPLKGGVTVGTLIGFSNGRDLVVRPDGYSNPQTFLPAYWELIP
jgi:hypothetical protein